MPVKVANEPSSLLDATSGIFQMVLSNSIDGVRQYPQLFSIEIHEVSIQRDTPLCTAFIRLKFPVVKISKKSSVYFL